MLGCLSIMSMFSFQAIHNGLAPQAPKGLLFIDYVNVLFSSNSQRVNVLIKPCLSCLSIMSMFSFQAIHNFLCVSMWWYTVVYRLCQCSLFKQFTTPPATTHRPHVLFIDYVNVLFSSNSQQVHVRPWRQHRCLSIMSMFSFQAIHNSGSPSLQTYIVVYRLCQCSLFKQFTTMKPYIAIANELFIDYVNVLFSSNSQLYGGSAARDTRCLSIMSMFSFQAIHNY